MLKVALIGFGGIAQLHRYAYWHYNKQGMPVRLVAACDANPQVFSSMTKINLPLPEPITDELPFAIYTDWQQMLDEQKPDLVDICLPTKFHDTVTIDILKQGYSVLCEKPMAATYEQTQRMLEAASQSDGQLMIGQCVRFYPQYEYLYHAVRNQQYGTVLEASFSRVSPLPMWGNDNWRKQDPRNGSSLTELNVHDIDVMQHIFGNPRTLSCHLESRVTPNDYSESHFQYDEFTVTVISAWLSQSEKFCMRYRIRFETGTLDFDGKAVTFTDNNGNTEQISLPEYDGIVGEIGYYLRVLSENQPNDLNPPKQSAHTIYLLEQCFESAEENEAVIEVKPL